MIGIRTATIFAVLVAQCLGSHTSSAGAPLRDRIPSLDRKRYEAVESARDWKNPFLIVRRDGIEVIGVTHNTRLIAANRIRLIKLLKRVGIAVENWPSA